ncbi:hypothetical protein WMY93_000285 [Mugilogobius chulae]|uniref:Fibronectin type-III domain-containing protein n=1 Tax=Mugilogobius chulae TaxID=88201 RepID=A0AAW0Q1P5_9GOBI
MASDCNKPVELAALGRPFALGMLYDCRRDSLIPGLTLWDQEKLDKDMKVTPKPYTKTEIVASESVSEKASSLGVDAALKASFLCGLVQVQGSAKYLNDNKKSRKQARVTLQYKTTTEFKTLTMNQLSADNIKHRNVIDKGLATHVVTAILYGADAFFVFDQDTSEDENVQNIQGNLKVVVKKLPKISIEGEGSLKMNDRDKENMNKFSCTFHGDFRLDTSPTTFEESVKVYQDLPKLLGPKGENAVPVRVHLLPLSTLDSKAAKLVRQISLRLVTEAESILEDFRELDFKLGLEGTLAIKLPSIRGGGEEEAGLAEVLKKTKESPFNSQRLKQWMSEVNREANMLKALTNVLKNTEVVSSEDVVIEKVCGSEKALVFVFTSLDSKEPYLEELENHLKRTEPNESRAEPKRWYKTKEVIERMRSKAKVFGDFADANKDQDRTELQFLAVSLADENHKDATIYLYEDGFQSCDNFELPCKPSRVTLGRVTENSVSVQFSAPSDGAENVCRYRVEFCEEGQEQWKQQEQKEAGEVTVTGLIPNTDYRVRVRAVTEVGLGPAAPHICFKTAPATIIQRFMKDSVKIKRSEIYKLSKKSELNPYGYRKYVFGKESQKEDRTVVLVGPAGSGKTSLINAMINYILGVKWTDPFWFLLCEEQKTFETVLYQINHQEGFQVDFSLTIIDTPGYDDSDNTRRFYGRSTST